MQEQWEIRWADYYQVFQLQPSAELEVISAVYKRLAAKYHPDNKTTGDEVKFRMLNEANEVLADPVRRAAYNDAYTRRQLADESRDQAVRDEQQRRATAAQREQAEQQRREDQARQKRQEEETRRKQLPIVYPAFQPPPRYQLYDYLGRVFNEDAKAMAAFFLGILMLMIPPALLLRAVASLFVQTPEAVLDYPVGRLTFFGVLGLWGTFLFGNLYADDRLYRVQTARKSATVWLPPRDAWPAITGVLATYRYHGHRWAVKERTEDAEDATEKLVATLVFSYKLLGFIEVPYALTVTVKVKESGALWSHVCYWFDTRSPWYWLFPAAAVVKQTNDALLKVLPGVR